MALPVFPLAREGELVLGKSLTGGWIYKEQGLYGSWLRTQTAYLPKPFYCLLRDFDLSYRKFRQELEKASLRLHLNKNLRKKDLNVASGHIRDLVNVVCHDGVD